MLSGCMYQLSDIDIRLLRVFKAVVECRGFSNAQAVLNVGQSTISNHIGKLEQRLGFRLCDRGRTGFRLTRKGESVYRQALAVFKAHESFQNVTLELKGKLSGFLRLGVIDSTITDPNCPVVRGIELLNNKASEVTINLLILTPNRLERAVMETEIDVAVGTFDRKLPDLSYTPIYSEVNALYCASGHPVASISNKEDIISAVQQSRKVTRSYLEGRDLFPLGEELGNSHASVEFLEAAAMLLLGGGHVGFLPIHYTKEWVANGLLVPILQDHFKYVSDFFVVTRKNVRDSVIVSTFLTDLEIAMDEIRDREDRFRLAESG